MIEIPTAIVLAFCALGGLVITLGGIIVRQAVATSQNASSAKAARAIAEEAKIVAGTALNRAEQADKALADFRVAVARDYASHSAIQQLEGRLVQAIERLGDRFDRYVDKDKRAP